MRASVVIATYRRPGALRAALAALDAQTSPPAEIVIAFWQQDAQSATAVEELAAERTATLGLPKLVLVPTPVNTVTAKENAAMQAVSGDVVCFIDDDAVAHNDWLSRLLKQYSDPEVGAAGGRDAVYKKGRREPTKLVSRIGTVTWFGRLAGNHHERSRGIRNVHFLKGCNMSYRRWALVPLDTRLAGAIPYGFEVDLGFAVRRQGLRVVYDPEAQVDHFASSDMSPENTATAWVVNHNQTYVLLKHFSWPRKLAFLAYSFAIGDKNAVGLARAPWLLWRSRGDPRPLWSHVGGKLAGLRTYLDSRRGRSGVASGYESGQPLPLRQEADASDGPRAAEAEARTP